MAETWRAWAVVIWRRAGSGVRETTNVADSSNSSEAAGSSTPLVRTESTLALTQVDGRQIPS